MQHIDDIRHKYFMECKKIISDLLYTENAEDLADSKFMVDKLLEKVSFLKVMSETPELFSINSEEPNVEERPEVLELAAEEEIFESNEKLGFADSVETRFEFVNEEPQTETTEESIEKEIIEEPIDEKELETAGTNGFEETVNVESTSETDEIEEENTVENLVTEELIEEASISEEAYQKTAEQVEIEVDDRRETPEMEQPEISATKENYFEESVELPHHKPEKKFKLPHIKGLKTIESLFDDDPLEHGTIKEEPGSLLKSNVSTDFMEAEKPKQEFKLDLNDRIAFSKMLFNGSQSDMNDAVNTLNSFKTLDEAKEYLSDIYYQKNWKKVDEYAQRLWHLVENKFQ